MDRTHGLGDDKDLIAHAQSKQRKAVINDLLKGCGEFILIYKDKQSGSLWLDSGRITGTGPPSLFLD